MEKSYKISILLDFYKNMLTDKQVDALELYYNEDLSLAEISEHLKITRQGVRDLIKRGEAQLITYEEGFGLADKYSEFDNKLLEVREIANQVIKTNINNSCNLEINKLCDQIIKRVSELII